MRRLVIAIYDGSDQLHCAHIAESVEEAEEVCRVAISRGPVWTFDLNDDEPLQYWEAPNPQVFDPKVRDQSWAEPWDTP